MPNAGPKERAFRLPEIGPGRWRGDILGRCTVNFGNIVQPGEPRRSVEFTYMVMPAAFIGPGKSFVWPGVVIIFAPTAMEPETPDAGYLFATERLPLLHVSLSVMRAQFSDMLPRLEAGRLKNFHFAVEPKVEETWPISSWGMTADASDDAI